MNDDIEDDPKNWKWGIVYFNPNDSRVFVNKRVGIGWTLNFARPASFAFPIGLVLLIVLLRILF